MEDITHRAYWCKDCRNTFFKPVAFRFGLMGMFGAHPPPQTARCNTCGNPEARYVRSTKMN